MGNLINIGLGKIKDWLTVGGLKTIYNLLRGTGTGLVTHNGSDTFGVDPILTCAGLINGLLVGRIVLKSHIIAKIFIDKGIKNIRFYIFGDGPERQYLENYIIENKITNVVFKGKVDKKYIPNILSKSNLNIFCLEYLPNLFKYGLSPNKMFEYFASGKPVISNVECSYDMLKKYNCGKRRFN